MGRCVQSCAEREWDEKMTIYIYPGVNDLVLSGVLQNINVTETVTAVTKLD